MMVHINEPRLGASKSCLRDQSTGPRNSVYAKRGEGCKKPSSRMTVSLRLRTVRSITADADDRTTDIMVCHTIPSSGFSTNCSSEMLGRPPSGAQL
jgi:hypothetical protein